MAQLINHTGYVRSQKNEIYAFCWSTEKLVSLSIHYSSVPDKR